MQILFKEALTASGVLEKERRLISELRNFTLYSSICLRPRVYPYLCMCRNPVNADHAVVLNAAPQHC